MLTATTKHHTISERPAEEHTPQATATEEVITVGAQQGTRSARRDWRDYRALPAHLSLLRDALAAGADRHQEVYGKGEAGDRHAAPCRRGPARVAGTTQLTLAQWVSRTASIGNRS
ncbi:MULTISPECIES: hypothetical protein [unclassified Streptomyces]|uniref:hypothetical protein n=1 Tax=unclassified Streptomyces TaxID=2593676 RepID=UPI0036E5118A